MALASEPPEDSSSLPGDPAAYRKKGAGAGFWFAIIFAGLGAALALFAWLALPRLLAPANGPETPAAARPFSLARPAPPAPEPATAALAVAPPPMTDTATDDAGDLEARVARVENDQRRASGAAAAALAAASLAEAAQGSAPFADELAALSGVLPASPDARALQQVAVFGAPTRAALSAEFPSAAGKAAVAARARAQGDGLLGQISHGLAAIVTIRRVDSVSGDGPDAVLARAEALVVDGDLAGAFAELDKLPEGAREAIAPWRARAQRRLEVDRRVSAIRAAALQDLTLAAGKRL